MQACQLANQRKMKVDASNEGEEEYDKDEEVQAKTHVFALLALKSTYFPCSEATPTVLRAVDMGAT